MFLLIHTSSLSDSSQGPQISLNLATRTADCQNYTFQKVADPVQPFGLNRSPPHYFNLRLRDFPPNMQDLIVMASTASTDIGLLTRSKVPLTNEKPPENVTGVFTMTEQSDDSRRAQLPLSMTLGDTSPIGVGLDLSSRENVSMPIPGDEITESSNPTPALMVLNNEGILASWWIIYAESIRNNTIYPGLVNAAQQGTNATSSISSLPSSITGISATGQNFGNPNPSSFGMVRPAPTFGSPSQPGSSNVFGAPSSLGRQLPIWGVPSNQNALSSTNHVFGGNAFNMNNKVPPLKPAFGVPGFSKASQPVFGASPLWATSSNTAGEKTSGNLFSSEGKKEDSFQNPFGAYVSNPGFLGAALPLKKEQDGVQFKLSNDNSSSPQVSGKVNEAPNPSSFGLNNSGKFVLGSTFKPDLTEKIQSKETEQGASNSLFGQAFINDLHNEITSQTSVPALSKADHNQAKDMSEYQNTPMDEVTDTKNIFNTQKMSLLSSNYSETVDSSSTSTIRPITKHSPSGLGPEENLENEALEVEGSDQKPNSTHVEQELVNKPTSPKILAPEASLYPDSATTASPSNRKSACSIPTPESPHTPEISFKPQPSSELSSHSISSSSKTNAIVDNRGVSDFENNHKSTSPSCTRKRKEKVPCDSRSDHWAKEETFKTDERSAQIPEMDNSSEGQISRHSLSTDVSSRPEDDGISLSDVEEGGDEDSEDDEDDSSRSGTDNFREEENQDEINRHYNIDSEGNQLGLSPEGSYDIVEDNILEGNELTKSSKSENNAQSRTPFNGFEPITSEKEEYHLPSALIQESNAIKLKSLESCKASSKIDAVLQNTSPESKTEESDKRIPFGNTKRNEQEQRQETNLQIDYLTQRKLEEEQYNEILARKEKEKKLQAEIVAQTEAEEKRRNKIIAERKAEEKRHNQLVAQREAEEKRRNQIIAQTKAEENRHNELIAQWEAEEKRREELKAKKEAEEKQALVDEDDMYMQSYLASDIDRTTRLNDFIAHSDYVSTTSGDNIPAQVERVYRDINSMIDTLGLNSRSLKEFIFGHSEGYKRQGRSRDDLNDDSNWVLGEIGALTNVIEKDLAYELKSGFQTDFEKKTETFKELQNNLRKLRAKHFDIKKLVATSQDPDHIAMARALPLGAKETLQQQTLRREFMKFQRLLSEVEEGIAILKAKIVTQSVSYGRLGSSNGLTVEAIMRTTTKLTSMAEKKSGDIDILESQIRRLKLNPNFSTSHQEPLLTPVKRGSSYRNSISNIHGLYTPERVKCSPLQNSLIGSANSFNQISPPRRKLSGYSSEEKAQLRLKLDRKKEVISKLRSNLESAGVTISPMENDD